MEGRGRRVLHDDSERSVALAREHSYCKYLHNLFSHLQHTLSTRCSKIQHTLSTRCSNIQHTLSTWCSKFSAPGAQLLLKSFEHLVLKFDFSTRCSKFQHTLSTWCSKCMLVCFQHTQHAVLKNAQSFSIFQQITFTLVVCKLDYIVVSFIGFNI